MSPLTLCLAASVCFLECSAPGPSQLRYLPHCPEPMASQEVQVYLKEWLGRGLLVPSPEFSEVDVSQLGAGLSVRRGLSSPECLTACTCPEHGLAPGLLPGFSETRPRLFRVFFPCAVPLTARAHAQLLPDSQGNRCPVGQGTVRMAIALAQDDRGLEPLSGRKTPDPDADMPALLMLALRARVTAQTRVRLRVEDHGTRPRKLVASRHFRLFWPESTASRPAVTCHASDGFCQVAMAFCG
jgi:hypothetical protein